MNNRETIEQVERGYRMAQPAHMLYPESKTHPKEVVTAQANVYKVSRVHNSYQSSFVISVGDPDAFELSGSGSAGSACF
jgi:hypothetical protein